MMKDKKKKMLIISLLALVSLLLLTLFTGENNADSETKNEVSLRSNPEEVSIDDMMNRQNQNQTQSSTTSVYDIPSSEDQTVDDPEAIKQVQELILENQKNIASGKDVIAQESKSQYIPEYVTEDLSTSAKPSPSKKVNKPLVKTPPPSSSPIVEEPKKSIFNTVSMGNEIQSKNAIKAYVHSNQIVSIGSTLKMRIAEDCLTDNNITIPKNSPIFGEVKSIDGERVMVEIKYINYNGNILPFKKEVYSRDALVGIYVPGNPKSEINKDVTEGAISGLPSDIPLDPSMQLAANLTNAAVSAGKQAIGKVAKTTKVLIKTNYELYLRPKKN